MEEVGFLHVFSRSGPWSFKWDIRARCVTGSAMHTCTTFWLINVCTVSAVIILYPKHQGKWVCLHIGHYHSNSCRVLWEICCINKSHHLQMTNIDSPESGSHWSNECGFSAVWTRSYLDQCTLMKNYPGAQTVSFDQRDVAGSCQQTPWPNSALEHFISPAERLECETLYLQWFGPCYLRLLRDAVYRILSALLHKQTTSRCD